jgi:predicted phosphodiesterase
MKLAWLTDIHLDFLRTSDFLFFAEEINASGADAVVISGDIAQSFCVNTKLMELSVLINKKIYFVLGNHDYYRSSIEKTNKETLRVHDKYNMIHWLRMGIYPLSDTVCLTGHEGWYDARLGNVDLATRITDFDLIKDFNMKHKSEIAEIAKNLAIKSANEIEPTLIRAAKNYKTVIFATHVPPFPDASLHRNVRSEVEYLPWYSNMTFGVMLSELALKFPDTRFICICGHTHCPAYYKHFDNLEVLAGISEYKNPQISKIFDVGEDVSWRNPFVSM